MNVLQSERISKMIPEVYSICLSPHTMPDYEDEIMIAVLIDDVDGVKPDRFCFMVAKKRHYPLLITGRVVPKKGLK